MSLKVGVVDYGMGNLHSVAKALSLQGGDVVVSDQVNKLKKSKLLVLPGVGSFGAAAKTLAKKRLDKFIRSWIKEDRPYLGICLGFQLLFESSEEDPGVKGLSVLKGKVVRFQMTSSQKKKLPIPHMGWNQAVPQKKTSLFRGISQKDYFYYVHTFFPKPKKKDVVLTETQYGKSFCSSVKQGRLFASQFHPEKSGKVGLTLLKNVLREASKS